MGPTAIAAHLKQLGKKTTKGGEIKVHHVNTLLYGSTRAPTAPKATGKPKASAVAVFPHPPPATGQEATGNDAGGAESIELELLTMDDRQALPGYVDDKGHPIRPQTARLELFRSAEMIRRLAMKDYEAARKRNFDACKKCGATDDKLLARLASGIRMADTVLVSAENSEERAARVQITQLNFNLGSSSPEPDSPLASTEPVLNVDMVRLLASWLRGQQLELQAFFSFVEQERARA